MHNSAQVFNGLKTLAAHDEQYKGPKDIDTTQQMVLYLSKFLLLSASSCIKFM